VAVSSSKRTPDLVMGRYRVAEVVGRGSFGRVLKVIDAQTAEARALKISARDHVMLLDEFAQLARLRHPSLPRVFDVGRTAEPIDDVAAGAPFFVAEWIGGGRADARRWDEPQAVWGLLADLAGALAAVHGAGLVHGDVSPANVLLSNDGERAVLVDLGLAARERTGGDVRGTPAYMAPETFAGDADARSDLYGLGAVVIRLVTGRAPFEAASAGELVQRIVTGGPPPPLPMLPRPLADLVGRLVARDPASRPASALAVLDELDQIGSAIAPDSPRTARPKVGPAPAPASWQGAQAVVDELASALAARPDVHVIVGEPATGARQLVDAAVRRHQLDLVARGARGTRVRSGGLDALAAQLGLPAPRSDAEATRWPDTVARAIAADDALAIVQLDEDPRAAGFIGALARTDGTHHTIAIVDAAEPAGDVHVIRAPRLDRAGIAALAAQMLGRTREPTRAWLDGLLAASGGLPMLAIELVRSIAGTPDPFAVEWTAYTSQGATALRRRQLDSITPAARRIAQVLAVCGGREHVANVLAVARAGSAASAVGLSDVVELERAGLVRRIGADEIAIDRATAEAVAGGELASVGAAGLATLRDPSRDTVAALLVHAPMSQFAERACDAAAELLARGRADRARVLAERAMTEPAFVARAALIAARAAAASGAYRDVTRLATAARDAGADRVAAELVIARAAQRAGDLDGAEATLAALHHDEPANTDVAGAYARLLVTRSRFADARRVALADGPLSGLRAEAAGLAAFYVGELDAADQAFAALEVGAAAAGDAATVGRALSLRGMVAQQRGQLGLASDRYREAARRLAEVGEVHAGAVAELNLGTVLSERGRASEALPRLAAARRVFAELGATTEQVAADLNRGNALLALGQAEDAQSAAELAVLHADGAPHLHAFALLVLGDALRRLGEDRSAERAYRDALALAIQRDDAHAQVSAYIALAEAGLPVDVDVAALCASDDDRDRWTVARGRLALRAAERRKNRSGAHAVLRETGSHATLRENTSQAVPRDDSSYTPPSESSTPASLRNSGPHAALRESGSHASLHDTSSRASQRDSGVNPELRDHASHAVLREDAPYASTRVLGSSTSLRAAGASTAARDTISPRAFRESGSFAALRESAPQATIRVADADVSEAGLLALAQACREVAQRASDGDRLERAFRAFAVATRLATRGGDPVLERQLADRARAAHTALVGAAAPVFRAALDADPDLALLPAAPEPVARPAGDESPLLRRLLTLSRRLNSETDVERILDEVIDTAIELTAAERGFLLLRQADGELAPVVSRNFAMGDLESGERSVSRSIAERAAQTGEPVVTVDAGVDERFAVAASVAALRLRSVLVVPLRQRGAITGCIYVDHRLRGGAFDDGAASVLGELADIAAIAIENARLTDDLRRSTREVDELNRKLSSELADREAELARAKADLPDRDRLRNRYEAIAGKSPAMVRMLDVLDRAAATSLPVVIVGESGTGKELVARALHDNGPRRDAAFVAINCSAVPEALLESELFGHVRGAFTGADRDRRGLFEVADGGTLFLDEIADTSAGMQAKLLRVLQDGMIRRVGDTRTRKVDVRVVAATQRSLAELVTAGSFREDLRFRLEVITVPVPPLREREGDVPLLVERLLAQMTQGRPTPRITRAAMRALGQHRWPGNVRELENALARGLAMAGDVIDVGDLPEALAAAAARPEPVKPSVGEDLRLNPALLATEQAYISAAMARAKGNQTVAARLLGLSRFGLQKKLRRLAGEDDASTEED
jgi:transcriptional regulator with GAF, ATPase, and Fis domain/tetratricopeptide (TPR) repeat protein